MLTTSPDVMGLVRDVTHGMSDTTSKVGQNCNHSVYYHGLVIKQKFVAIYCMNSEFVVIPVDWCSV